MFKKCKIGFGIALTVVVLTIVIYTKCSFSVDDFNKVIPPKIYNDRITSGVEFEAREMKELYKKGIILFERQLYEESIEEFKKILEKYPDGDCCTYSILKIRQCSQEIIQKQVEKDSYSKEIDSSSLIKKFTKDEEDKSAIDLIIESEIKYAEANFLRDEMPTKKNRVKAKKLEEDALENHYKIIKEYPDNKLTDNAQYKIGWYYINEKSEYERAIQEFKKVIESYPQRDAAIWAQRNIARCYESQGKYRDAINEYCEIIEKYPKSMCAPEVQWLIAGIYDGDFKDYSQAIIEYQKVIDNYPDFENIESVKMSLSRCKLLIEFQKRGVDVTEYRDEDPERLSLLLKLYDKGVKEKDIRRLLTTIPLEELKRLLDQEEIFEFKDEPFTPSTEPLIEEEEDG